MLEGWELLGDIVSETEGIKNEVLGIQYNERGRAKKAVNLSRREGDAIDLETRRAKAGGREEEKSSATLLSILPPHIREKINIKNT